MIGILKMKLLYLLFGSRMRRNRTLIGILVLFLLFIMNIVKIHLRFVAYLEYIFIIFILYTLIKKIFFKNTNDNLKHAINLYELNKNDEALEIINNIIDDDLSSLSEKENKKMYYECIFNKALCLERKYYKTGDMECFKEGLKLEEEVLEYYFEENKDTQLIKFFIGQAYFNYGYINDNKDYLKASEQNLLSALEEDEKRNYNLICDELLICYMELSNYYSKEEYIKKSWDLVNNLINNINKDKYNYFNASLDIDKARVIRKLSEINPNAGVYNQSRESLERAMSFINNRKNNHYKKYFPSIYISQVFLELKGNYEIYRITKENKYLEKFRELSHELKEFKNEEKSIYIDKKIDELMNEAI